MTYYTGKTVARMVCDHKGCNTELKTSYDENKESFLSAAKRLQKQAKGWNSQDSEYHFCPVHS